MFNGKEKLVALEVYPDITLAQAREKRNEAKQQLAEGNDLSFVKQIKQRAKHQAAQNSFEDVAREGHAKFLSKWTKGHANTKNSRLEKNIFPWIGSHPISDEDKKIIVHYLAKGSLMRMFLVCLKDLK